MTVDPGTNSPVPSRGHWGSRLGFVLAAAGSAVGLGNLWKFPYISYKYGGGDQPEPGGAGAFILVYLICIAVIGLPIMIAELMVGRRSQKGPVGAFKALKPEKPWWLVGILAVVTGFLLLSFYGVVAGWTIEYTKKAIVGEFVDPGVASVAYAETQADAYLKANEGAELTAVAQTDFGAAATFADGHVIAVQADAPEVAAFMATDLPGHLFGEFVGDGTMQVIYLLIFMLITMLVVAGGVSGGIERAAKVLMPVLLLILVALAVRVMTLDGTGASDALGFMFDPDFSMLTGDAILEAIGHSFFTLSLGMGAMVVYGSYLRRGDDLVKAAVAVTIADTIVALLAAFIIFGAIFSLGVKMESGGAGNLFIAIPAMFEQIPGGAVLLPIFYVLVGFAALTSAISLLEVVVSYFIDERGWSRAKAVALSGGTIFVFGILSALSFSVLADVKIADMTIFDLLDYLVANWALPLGGLFIALFAGVALSNELRSEEMGGRTLTVAVTTWSLRIVAPVAILATMIYLLFLKD